MKLSMDKKVLILLSSIVVVILVLIASFVTLSAPYDKNNKKNVIVEIPMGCSVDKVAHILKEKNLIKNEFVFKVNFKIKGNYSNMKSGKYLFNKTYSNDRIIKDLSSGKIYHDGIKITIPEGSTSKEIIDILIAKKLGKEEVYQNLIDNPKDFYKEFEFLNQKDIKSLEGFLYPSTYHFDENSTEKEILSQMLSLFDRKYTKKLRDKQIKENMTLQEVVNLASIVEKEAALDEDRPIIASVFLNRLDKGMLLQSDATIQYAFDERKKTMTYKDLKIKSPYNTYLEKGLPPTPVSNPSIKSIEAVLNPSKTNYLYFVATIDGGNVYSEKYEDHVENVKQYRKDREERNKALENS